MTKGSEDYSRGKALPSPVTPASTVCFKITIPDAVQYRAALFGVLSQLSQWYTWDHPTDGTNCSDCEEAAQLWAKALSEAYFDEDCEGEPVSCDDVADCIQNDEGVQAALASQIASQGGIQQDIYNTSYYGTPMSPEASSANLTGSAGCDLNALFGSITAIVDQLNRNNIFFLNRLEVTSNTIERVQQLVAAIPIFETLPVDDVAGFANTLQEDIKENYEGTYTDAYRDEIRCALFCAARDATDCEVTWDILIDYFEDRLGASFDPNALFLNFVTYFTVGSWAGTQIIDVMTLCQLIVWKTASNWLGLRLRTIQMVGALGANDDDPDWEILCEDCPPTDWCRHLNAAHDLEALMTPDGSAGPQAVWSGGKWIANAAVYNSRITLLMDMLSTYNIKQMRFVFDGTNAVGDLNSVYLFTEGFGSLIGDETLEENVIIPDLNVSLQKIQIDVASSTYFDVPLTVGLTDIYVRGSGPVPTWGEDCS